MSAVNTGDSVSPPSRRRSLLARAVDQSLPAVAFGRLTVTLPDGETIVRTGSAAGPEAHLTVHRGRALRRILLGGEAGFSDGFIAGDWSTPDLLPLLSFMLANEAALAPGRAASWIGALHHRLRHALRANTPRGSRRNCAAHYDLGNAFYAHWLDSGMNYSAALYRGGESLEAAQTAKIERVVELLDLDDRHRVLEIGCGWGALAARLAPLADYTGITLSAEQHRHAVERLAGAERRADVRLQDYRDVAGTFDRIVSIEMFEAVGERYWPVYFARLRGALAAGGVAVLQVITIAADRFAAYRRRPDFIQRHIFPGGMLPTLGHIEALAAQSGFTIGTLQSFGGSYAETLAEWRRRFNRSWTDIAPLGFDERFRRMWEYYLAYCETGFRYGTIDVSLIQLRG